LMMPSLNVAWIHLMSGIFKYALIQKMTAQITSFQT